MNVIVSDKDEEIKTLRYVIDTQKAEIILLRKSLTRVCTKSRIVLELSDCLNETVNSHV